MDVDKRVWAARFLLALNILLLASAWMMSLYAYPGLPLKLRARLSFLGLEYGPPARSLLFFILPLAQSLITLALAFSSRRFLGRGDFPRKERLRAEYRFLALIFVNSIFIHLQRNNVSLAYLGEPSFSLPYLIGLTAVTVLVLAMSRLVSRYPL
jgi:hypothetical protein